MKLELFEVFSVLRDQFPGRRTAILLHQESEYDNPKLRISVWFQELEHCAEFEVYVNKSEFSAEDCLLIECGRAIRDIQRLMEEKYGSTHPEVSIHCTD